MPLGYITNCSEEKIWQICQFSQNSAKYKFSPKLGLRHLLNLSFFTDKFTFQSKKYFPENHHYYLTNFYTKYVFKHD